MVHSDNMNGRPSPYVPASVLKKRDAAPPSSLAKRSVQGPYSLSVAPPVKSSKEARGKESAKPEA